MAKGPDKFQELEDWRELARTPAQQQEYEAGRAARRTRAHWVGPLFLLVGLLVLAWGILASRALWGLELSGVRAPGVVSAVESVRDSNGPVYHFHAVVTFTTRSGQQVSFRDPTGASAPLYRKGETVIVLYRPERPDGAIIDRGPWRNWLTPMAMYVFGGGFLLFGVAIFRSSRAGAPANSGG